MLDVPKRAPKVAVKPDPPIGTVTPPLAKMGSSGGMTEGTLPDFDDIMNSPTPVRNDARFEGTKAISLKSRPSWSAAKLKFVRLAQ